VRRDREPRRLPVEQRVESQHTRPGLAAHHHHAFNAGARASRGLGQPAVIEAAENAGHDQHARPGLAGDERHLALAIDGQDRVAHRPDAVEGDGEHRPFPPARQLPGHDVPAPTPRRASEAASLSASAANSAKRSRRSPSTRKTRDGNRAPARRAGQKAPAAATRPPVRGARSARVRGGASARGSSPRRSSRVRSLHAEPGAPLGGDHVRIPGGSHTNSTSASLTPRSRSIRLWASIAIARPIPQPGAVSVISLPPACLRRAGRECAGRTPGRGRRCSPDLGIVDVAKHVPDPSS